jgi:hypothetical protein
MNLVDDAQGTTHGLMASEETTQAAMKVLWEWVERYGIPQSLYVDKKNVYVTNRKPTVEEQLADQEPRTAFGVACAKLGIEIIPAHSPQAKGRVERSHGVYQDRFVKELALRGITTIETANRLLRNGFGETLNQRFAREPASSVDFHRPVPKGMDLADVFCFEEFRTVQNDWTIRYENRHYQILEANRPLPKPKDRVVVRKRLDGSLHVLFQEQPLQFQALPAREVRRRANTQQHAEPSPRPVRRPFAPAKPTPDHPWRRFHLQAAREEKTP